MRLLKLGGWEVFGRRWHLALWRVWKGGSAELRFSVWWNGRSWTGFRVMTPGRIARAPK